MEHQVHIGKLIEQVMKSQGRSPSWLAKQINCERTNIYSIYKRESIDCKLLARISNCLGVNFFEYLMESQNEEQ